MKTPILITAFPPFAIFTRITGNPSEIILNLLREQSGNHYHYRLLPVSDLAVSLLAGELASQPAGVLMMGFDPLSSFGCGVNLELGANTQAGYVTSKFAREIAKAANGQGISTARRIGSFYCNKVYGAAIQWGNEHDAPVAFLHLGYAQQPAQLRAVESILQAMEQFGG